MERGLRYSRKGLERPGGRMGWLGRNFRASGLGVFSVCMNMLRLPPTAAAGLSMLEGWCRGCSVGLERAFEAAIAGSLVLWCTFRQVLGWRMGSEGFDGRGFVNRGAAAREIFLVAMFPATLI